MGIKTLSMPEDAIVSLLKSLEKKKLPDIFWKVVVESDVSPLKKDEKKDREKAREELKRGLTVKWKDLR
jgi:hypothetical protein